MSRKFALWLLAMLLATAVSLAEAQLPAAKAVRLGYLTLSSLAANSARRQAFLDGLRQLGYVEGRVNSF